MATSDNMNNLLLLASLLGLAMADTNPRDFDRLCDSDARCPDNWKLVEGNCIKFAGWDVTSAEEDCKQNQAEYKNFTFESTLPLSSGESRSQHTLPVCLVRRETQCDCGKANRKNQIVGGMIVEKNEYPWQGKVHQYKIYKRQLLITDFRFPL